MSSRVSGIAAFLAGAVLILFAVVMLAPAQRTAPLTVPRTADGKPDLSGIWERPYVPDMTKNGRNQKGTPDLAYTPTGEKEWKTYDAANGDYTGTCLPFGLTRSINAPYPMQIVQTQNYVVLLHEQNNWFHRIPIDGRGHPKEVEPTWFGHSAGKWDGDTLVVDTIGFNGYTKLDTVGHPLSDALHVTETFKRVDGGRMEYAVTIDDPKTYLKPWKNERTFVLRTDWDLMEYSCEENNKDLREGLIKWWRPPVK